MPADHCTLWLDRLAGKDWSECCRLHDLAYDAGLPRLAADLALEACVTAAGAPLIARLMFAGVALFGWIAYQRAARKRRGRSHFRP